MKDKEAVVNTIAEYLKGIGRLDPKTQRVADVEFLVGGTIATIVNIEGEVLQSMRIEELDIIGWLRDAIVDMQREFLSRQEKGNE